MFVVGCHRSGTSYVSGLLSGIVGCSRPNDLDRTVDNPRGYFESTLLRPFNDQLLSAAGFSWDRPPLTPVHWSQGRYLLQAIRRKPDFAGYALTEQWVDKDPRLSLTRPLFEHLLLKRIPCVFVIRHPLHVARSLQLRDGFSLEKSLLIWLLYNRGCAIGYQPNFDQIVSYEGLLAGDETHLVRLQQFLAARLPVLDINPDLPLDERIIHAHRDHTDQSLRRNQGELNDEDAVYAGTFAELLRDHCCSIFESIKQSSFSPSIFVQNFYTLPSGLIDNYDRIVSEGMPSLEFLRLHETSSFAPLDAGLSGELSTAQYGQDQQLISDYASLLNAVHELRQELSNPVSPSELESLQSRIDAIEASASWRITAPLRHLLDRLKHFNSRRS